MQDKCIVSEQAESGLMQNKYIVFDWDGTLHDTKYLYAEAVRIACDEFALMSSVDYAAITPDGLSQYLGLTPMAMWDDFAPNLEPSVKEKVSVRVGENMIRLIHDGYAKMYEEVPQMLDLLLDKGIKAIILSNCKIAYMEAIKAQFDLDRWFVDFYPSEKYNYASKSKILSDIMKERPGDYIMIGDRLQDVEAGRENGVLTIGCGYGFGNEAELSGADYIISSPMEIFSFLK
ncbi:MAG: HAD family hydrolase [Lachnospiraceae bacterium]|nr:HAD family hydrolase [Lachnospiraceae bacterium]